MRIGNNITNNAILNTMTNIRLAGEVVSYLSKGAQDEFRRQNRVTKYFEAIRENENNGGDTEMAAQGNARGAAQGRTSGRDRQYQTPLRREKIYVPKIMMDTMLSATGNGTSIHFGYGHCCRKHNRLFTLDHIEERDALTGVEDIRGYANKLKEHHILDWGREDRLKAIAAFVLLTLQM